MQYEDKNHEILLETGTNELEIAEFGIYIKGSENKIQTFGINVAKVREIIKTPDFILIPDTDPNIMGVFKLREKVVPLINLSKWLNEKVEDIDIADCFVIVTEFNNGNFGFLVHAIRTIHRVSWKAVLPPTSMNDTHVRADSITGLVPLEDKIMLMVDFEKIVADINPEIGMKIREDKAVIEESKNLGTGKTAIIAEDSVLMRDMITSILEKGGFNVVAANNGKLAWENIEKFHNKSKEEKKSITDYIQVVVSDIEMPQMDGHSLTKKIKDDEDLKILPVILFSSLIYEEMRRKGEAIGADAQISKPEIGNLLNIIKELLEKQKSSSASSESSEDSDDNKEKQDK